MIRHAEAVSPYMEIFVTKETNGDRTILMTYQLVKGAADGVIRQQGICAVITTIPGVTKTTAKLL